MVNTRFLVLASLLCACGSGTVLDSRSRFHAEIGADYTTEGVITGGRLIVGRNSAGVSYSEISDPVTGDVTWRGVSSTSMASNLFGIGSDGKVAWATGFFTSIGDPSVLPDGNILLSSGKSVYVLSPSGKPLWKTASAGSLLTIAADGSFFTAGNGLYATSPDGTSVTDLWTDPQVAGRRITEAPLIGSEAILYVVSAPPAAGPGGPPQLTALGLDGSVLWKVDLPKDYGQMPMLMDDLGQIWVPMIQGTIVYDRKGQAVTTYGGIAVTAIGSSSFVGFTGPSTGSSANSIQARDRSGKLLWQRPAGREFSRPVIGDDGRTYYAENTQKNDLDSSDYFLRTVGTGGQLYMQQQMLINNFYGHPVVLDQGTAYVTGGWVNQYPPFAAQVEGFDARAAGLAGPWSRQGGDNNRSHRSHVARSALPDFEALRGWWQNVDGGQVRQLWFGSGWEGFDELKGQTQVYGIWQQAPGAKNTLREAGSVVVSGDAVTFTPLWSESGKLGAAYARKTAKGDGWNLRMDDPLAGSPQRLWHRIYRQPEPPSPFASAGALDWNYVEPDLGTTSAGMALAVDAQSGRSYVAGSYWFKHTLKTLAGKVDLADPVAFAGALFGGLSPAGKLAWVDSLVANKDDPAMPVKAALDGAGNAVLLQQSSAAGMSVRRTPASGGAAHVSTFKELQAVDMVVAADGSLVVLGYAGDVVHLPDGTALGMDKKGTAWLAALGPDDSVLWSTTLASSGGYTAPQSLARDSQGRLWMSMHSQGQGVLPGGKTGPVSSLEVWALDAKGKPIIQHRFDGNTGVTSRLAALPDGDMALAGGYHGTLDVGSEIWSSPVVNGVAATEGFVMRLGPDATLRWARRVTEMTIGQITVDAFGNIVASAAYGRHWDAKGYELLYAAWDRCGNVIWQKYAQACESCTGVTFSGIEPLALAADSSGAIYATGSFYGGVQIGGTIFKWMGIYQENIPEDIPTANIFVHKLTGLDAKGQAALPKTCEAEAAILHKVTVTLEGSGQGSVVSDPPGISCPGTCSAMFKAPGEVTLTAKAAAGSMFVRWSGNCAGASACGLTMSSDHNLTARFDRPGILGLATMPGVYASDFVATDDGVYFAGISGGGISHVTVGRAGQDGTVVWKHVVDGTFSTPALASDGKGGVILGVGTSPTNTLDGKGLTTDGTGGLLGVHFDGAGQVLWARHWPGGGGSGGGFALGDDGQGSVSVVAPGTVSVQGKDVIGVRALRIGPDGSVTSDTPLGAGFPGQAAIDSNGNTLATWNKDDKLNYPAVVQAIDPKGSILWTFDVPGAGSAGIAPLPGGGVAVVLAAQSTKTMQLAGKDHWAFLARLDGTGNLLTALELPVMPTANANHTMVATLDGAVMFRGGYGGGVDLGPPVGKWVAVGTLDQAILRYGADDTLAWGLQLAQLGNSVDVQALGMAPGGNLVIGGSLGGNLTLGGLTATGKNDTFLLRLAP